MTYINKLKTILEEKEEIIDEINNLHKQIEYKDNNIVVTQLKDLGDFICLSPFLRNLKEKTNANIIFVCHKHVIDLIEHCPYIDKIVGIDKRVEKLNKNKKELYKYLFPIIKDILSSGSISLAISPYWSDYNQLVNLIHFLIGAKRRITYDETCYHQYLPDKDLSAYKKDVNLATDVLINPVHIIHEVDRNNYIIYYLFNSVNSYDLEVFITEKDHVNIDKNKTSIAVGLGGSSLSKHYPYEKLLKVFSTFPNVNFLLLGAEKDNVNYIPNNCINYVGKLSIRETISVISQCDLYLGNDSFFVHAAAAKKIPCIVLYKESKDKYNYYLKKHYNGYLSQSDRWYPYKTKYIALLPEHSLFPCNRKEIIIGGCESEKSHCISTIKEKDIVNSINILLKEINNNVFNKIK